MAAPVNLHHLRYFRAVAREGGLARAAARLNLSPSALSTQLRQLEERLGHALFERTGGRLALTEAGRIALDHAEAVVRAGEELVDTLRMRGGGERPASPPVLRVGAVTTLSRNFQLGLLRRTLARGAARIVVRSGPLPDLLAALDDLALDLVLSNQPAPRDAGSPLASHLLDEQPVGLVSRPPPPGAPAFRFPDDLRSTPVLLPGPGGATRAAFDLLLDRAGVRPVVLAEVDDMAMLRLLARESPAGVALVPPVVVQDELRAGLLVERVRVPGLAEGFWAVTRERRFPNPLLAEVLAAAAPRAPEVLPDGATSDPPPASEGRDA